MKWAARVYFFYGAQHIPKIIIPKEKIKQFELLWSMFEMEQNEDDDLKNEILRTMLKRLLLLSLRIYKEQNEDLPTNNDSLKLIREYNFLVEKHFKMYTKVADYAMLLFKSPKTLSNLFSKYINETPLQIINNRRILEAKRQLMFTDEPINLIAEDLNFNDIQSFSHFFKKNTGFTPTFFREKES